MAASSAPFRIAIIGSGPIGKLLACSSNTHPGLELVQYELDTLPLRPSFGYGVGPQSLRGLAVANAEVGRAVRAGCIISPTFMRVQHAGESEELLAEPKTEPGRDYGWIGRDELLDILDAKMPEPVRPVQYGKQLVSITKVPAADTAKERLQLDFQDGHKDIVDGIWACDGINSVCRKFLQGDEFKPPSYTGRIAFRGRIPAPEAVARVNEEIMKETYMLVGVDGWHILTFPIAGGKVLNIVAFCVQEEYTRLGRDAKPLEKDQILANFLGRGKIADAILQGMIDLTPGGCQRLDMMHLGQLGDFTNDFAAVTLFGDAANAMTPHIAGSMSTGIVGAATFILEWNKRLNECDGDVAKAFKEASKAYEATHKPLAQDLVNRSLEQGSRWSGGVTDPKVLLEHPKHLMYIADHLPLP